MLNLSARSGWYLGVAAALITEIAMTFMFPIIILEATHKLAPAGFAGVAIGPGLTLMHLISITVTNTSVNPAHRPVIGLPVHHAG